MFLHIEERMIDMSDKKEPKRVTIHNARKGKNGVFSASHNDRQYSSYDKDKSKNREWRRYKNMTFEEAEAKFYEEHFSQGLEKRNSKHIKSRHHKRVQTMDDYRKSAKTCPEETLFYIGNKDNMADDDDLWNIVIEQLSWEQKTFPQAKILNCALHREENGAWHVHSRKVYMCHDEDGNLIVGQEKALNEMGIYAQKPGEKIGRYNNAKMTYSKMIREHFIELCKQHGYEIIEEPKDASKTGLSIWEYIRQDEQEKLQEQQAENEKLKAENEELKKQIEMQKQDISDMAEYSDFKREQMKKRFEEGKAQVKENMRKAYENALNTALQSQEDIHIEVQPEIQPQEDIHVEIQPEIQPQENIHVELQSPGVEDYQKHVSQAIIDIRDALNETFNSDTPQTDDLTTSINQLNVMKSYNMIRRKRDESDREEQEKMQQTQADLQK